MITVRKTAERININNPVLLYTNGKNTPFSFFNLIFWKREIDPESESGNKILLHELTHVRQWHSLDRLLVNIVMIFAWVNPVFWLARRELFMVHEFAADKASIEQDVDNFARVLLTTAFPTQYQNITSHFHSSSIKRRLIMLTKKQKTRFGYLGRLLTLPLVLFVLAAFSINNKASMQQQSVIEVISSNKSTSPIQDTVKASFPGGDKGWTDFIQSKVNSQLDTLAAYGKSGTVVIAFVVDENGNLSDFQTTKNDIPFLSVFVTNALKEGRKWVPATVNSQKIKFYMKQPVTFVIQE